MAWTNKNKDTTTFTNVAKGSTALTWDEAAFTWTQGGTTTWVNPGKDWQNATKDTTTFTNVTKHS